MTTESQQPEEDLFAVFHDAFDDEPEEASNGASPLARNTDPETSHLAASQLTNLEPIKDRIVAFVTANPGCTRGEVADGMGEPQDRVWRRLSECVKKGRIVYGLARTYGGRKQQTCWPRDYPESFKGV